MKKQRISHAIDLVSVSSDSSKVYEMPANDTFGVSGLDKDVALGFALLAGVILFLLFI